jgi:hypothetical protein
VRERQAASVVAPGRGSAFARSAEPAVDEQALVRRYTRDGWPVAACARRFSISAGHARAILARNGVAIRRPGRAGLPDEDAVVRAYRKHRSVKYVAKVLHTSEENVLAILDKHGEPHGIHTPPPNIGTGQRPILARFRQVPPVEPSPADLLRPSQAANMLGVDVGFLKAAATAGRIHETYSPGGQRRYTRRDVADFGRRLHPSPERDPPTEVAG